VSVTWIRTPSALIRIATVARAPGACLTTLVSASWAILYADHRRQAAQAGRGGQDGRGRRARLGRQPPGPCCPGKLVVATEQAEHAAQLVEGATARLLDGGEGAQRLRGPGRTDPPSDAGLHRDHAHRVREHVVQLSRDQQPLLLQCVPAPLGLGAPLLPRLLGEACLVGAPLAHCKADEPHRCRGEHAVQHDVLHMDGDHCGEQPGADRRLHRHQGGHRNRAAEPDRHRVAGHAEHQVGSQRRASGGGQDGDGRRDHREHRQRPDPPDGHRQAGRNGGDGHARSRDVRVRAAHPQAERQHQHGGHGGDDIGRRPLPGRHPVAERRSR
jgi:hypothetical protein